MTVDPTQTEDTVRSAMHHLPLSELRAIVTHADEKVWTPLALEVAREVLAAREEEGEEAKEVICPFCGAATKPGVVSLQASLLSFLVVGFSWMHCWFDDYSGDRRRILRSGRRCRGHACPDCNAIVLEGDTFA